MRKCSIAVVLFFCSSLVIAQQTLTNDSIIKMAKAGLSDDLIVSTINTSSGKFDVTTDGLIALKSGGVSDKVVSTILLKRNGSAPLPAQISQQAKSQENQHTSPQFLPLARIRYSSRIRTL